MKLSVILCVIAAVATAGAEDVEGNMNNEEVFREEYCTNAPTKVNKDCASFRCTKDNTKIIGVTCAEAHCSGKPVSFKGDPSKPYPDCCMVPVCEDSK